MIPPAQRQISPVVISTALGHDGRGIFPYTLLSAYRRLLAAVQGPDHGLHQIRHPLSTPGELHPRQPPHLEIHPQAPGYGPAQRLRPHQRRGGILRPGYPGRLRAGFKTIPNLYPEFVKGTTIAIRETLAAVAIYQQHLGPLFRALELNYSCPNSEEAIAQNVVQALLCTRKVRSLYPQLYLVAKLSICHPYEFAQELERIGVNALHAVNTIPHNIVFPLQRSPLGEVGGGGVSGGPAFDLAYKYNRELRPKVGLFLIMGCGVAGPDDVRRYFDLGADAVSLCTLALRKPREATGIVLRYNG